MCKNEHSLFVAVVVVVVAAAAIIVVVDDDDNAVVVIVLPWGLQLHLNVTLQFIRIPSKFDHAQGSSDALSKKFHEYQFFHSKITSMNNCSTGCRCACSLHVTIVSVGDDDREKNKTEEENEKKN